MVTKKINLPKEFLLGAAASAWQTEGWTGKNTENMNYIDGWYISTPELWHNGIGPKYACDLYNRYKEDSILMNKVGLDAYRTSIDWSRFIKNYETCEVNEEAVKFYDNLIDEIKKNGVEPMLCLEHYELPLYLFKKYGGWNSKKVVDLYVKYAEQVFKYFGHKVKYWFTFNEPIVIQTRVYLDAVRWPFEQNTKKWMQWNYNKVLANAKVVKLFNEIGIKGKIGCILNPEVTYPRSSAEHDKKAAYMYDLYFNRIFMDPMIKGEYPNELIEGLKNNNCMFEYTDEELEIVKNNTIKFLGMNLYYPYRVKARTTTWNNDIPFHPSRYYEIFDLPGKKINPYRGWEIYPKIIYDIGMRLKEEYGNIEWIVSENGMGVQNENQYKNENGQIQDDYRIEYISNHLYWTIKAIEDGSNCKGYMLWAFTDNVSPQNAFKNRYGLIEINLDDNLNRNIKKSGEWYKKIHDNRYFEVNIIENINNKIL